jgi:hypothetical protein
MKHRPINSMSAAVEIAQHARGSIRPPKHIPLDETETLHFDSIIAEKANSEWTLHEVDIAAMFARTMRQLYDESRALVTEGGVVTGASGQPKANPRNAVVTMLVNQVLSYRRSLGIHSVAKMPNAADRARRNEIGREIQDGILGDDLIAKPDKPN